MPIRSNMYSASVAQWNPCAGCKYNCRYCKSSFQLQLKRWAKNHCERCYRFIPHEHPERLVQPLPETRPVRTFLLQSKNSHTFDRVKYPDNVILGTTIETNRDDGYGKISKAPVPSERYQDFLNVRHRNKMVTIEPVLDFDVEVLVSWINDIQPSLIWLGYDSRKNRLPEPPLAKIRALHWNLACRGFTVVLKTIRKAWWE